MVEEMGRGVELGGILSRDLLFPAQIKESEARNLLQDSQGDVGGDTEAHDQPLLVAIFRHIGNAVIHRVLWRADMHFLAIKPDLSTLRPVNAKEHPRHLCASSPHQARETKDLAPAKLEAHIGKNSRSCEMAYLQHHFPDLGLALGEKVGEFAPDHVLDDLFSIHLADRGRNDMCAVAQDGQAVGDLENFVQAVADEEYSHAALTQLLHNGK